MRCDTFAPVAPATLSRRDLPSQAQNSAKLRNRKASLGVFWASLTAHPNRRHSTAPLWRTVGTVPQRAGRAPTPCMAQGRPESSTFFVGFWGSPHRKRREEQCASHKPKPGPRGQHLLSDGLTGQESVRQLTRQLTCTTLPPAGEPSSSAGKSTRAGRRTWGTAPSAALTPS